MNYRRAVSGGVLLGDLHMQNSELEPVQKGSDAKQPEQSGKKIAWDHPWFYCWIHAVSLWNQTLVFLDVQIKSKRPR